MYPITPTKQGEKVSFKNPNPAFYEALGEDGIRALMYDFYDIIYESDIAHFFPQDPEEFAKTKEKNTRFFIQLCGGPKAYEEEAKGVELNEYMLRLHDDFSIYEKSRLEWLGAMREALEKVDIAQELKDDFWNYVEAFSKLTVNTTVDGNKYYTSL
ncbi:MAG TPA: globin [Epsilonproteobacteria bacterium]|nr:globin [Campylobacterota bacterium]